MAEEGDSIAYGESRREEINSLQNLGCFQAALSMEADGQRI